MLSILVSPPGNILYHLVLANSIVGALLFAFNHWRSSEFPQARRTMVGLGLLLLGQLLLFSAAALGWVNVINSEVFLPPIDRAVIVLSLLGMIWLWAFPEPSRAADSAAGLTALLVLAALALAIADYSSKQTFVGRFNGSFQETLWQGVSIALIVIGVLTLLVRRPSGWSNGVAALALAFAGHLLYLLTNSGTGDFPGAVRLAYMAAYPLLFTLPQRFPAPTSSVTSVKQEAAVPERRRYSTDPKTFHALLDLAAETNSTKVSQAVTRAIAQTMLADLCFLIYLTDNKNQMVIASGYDLIREEPLEGGSLNKTAVPMLAGAIQRGRPLRLPASATSADIKGLGEVLGIGNPGNLLTVPMLTKDKDSIGGILLLSPYSNRLWSAEDQAFLSNIATSLVAIVQRTRQTATLQQKEQAATEALEQARAQLSDVKKQNEQLTAQLEEALKKPAVSDTAYDVAFALEQAQQRIASLETELDSIRTAKRARIAGGDSQVEKELRLALEDIARLQNQLADANIKLLEMEKNQKAAHTNEQAEVVASISQELRQPMSSIVGYTDLLLGESVGILGALQRKFVERIKASTERIGSLIDDLIQVTTIEAGIGDLKAETVDLNAILDSAMSYTSSLVREKNISIHLDLPKQMAPIYADREALQQILIHLLQNAGAASPVEGQVTLKVQTRAEAGQDYVLFQVTDSGGGIPPEDLPRVFTRLYRADNVLIQGVGDTGVGLSIAKTLTEAQRGRIWVESNPGVGSTFSVLLPFAKTANPSVR